MPASMTRRRFLIAASMSSLATALPAETLHWEGSALGAHAQILMDHPDAQRLLRVARNEIERLENIFSLYRTDSEVVRLNREGSLAAPSFELVDCLATARHVHALTDGLFDPTVQPVWSVLAKAHADGRAPRDGDLAAARARVGFARVRFDNARIALGDGQALTLNGIAQGYIADRVAHLLAAEGLNDVLIDTGEIVGRGVWKGQEGWPVSIANSTRRLVLRDRALATSATHGTTFDVQGQAGHILHPSHAGPVPRRQISISADSAAIADALSTGLSLAGTAQHATDLIAGSHGVRLEDFT